MIDNDEIKKPSINRTWHELYIEMQSDPFDIRTDGQFCAEIALDVSTFRNWKCKYRKFIFAEVEKRRNEHRSELRTKGYKALTNKLDKDTNAVKLLFQLLGDLVEKTETKMEMSDADKIRRVHTLMGSISKKRQAWSEAEGKDTTPTTEPGPEAQEHGGTNEGSDS
jgi:hypothetical protein